MASGGNILAERLLTLEQLTCERDERPLFSGLNLDLCTGQAFQILGPNGSGKTTLLRTLAGLSTPARGRILWRGRPQRRCLWDFRQSLLYIGHAPGVKAALTPLENLRWYEALSAGRQQGDPREALARVGLAGYEEQPCYQLSAGQLRRVALARLYLSEAPLWILDEPFTAIDRRGVAELEERMAAHTARGGAVVLTSHQAVDVSVLQTLDLTEYPPAWEEDAYVD